MPYAVISLQGKQFKVEEGQTFVVDRVSEDEGKTFVVEDVLLYVDGKDATFGTPTIEKATVKLKVLDHHRGKKIRVAKYKAKARYRRVYGHRQHQSTLEVVSIKA